MGSSPMYQFLLGRWRAGQADEAEIRSYVGGYLTPEQAEKILATPKIGAKNG